MIARFRYHRQRQGARQPTNATVLITPLGTLQIDEQFHPVFIQARSLVPWMVSRRSSRRMPSSSSMRVMAER